MPKRRPETELLNAIRQAEAAVEILGQKVAGVGEQLRETLAGSGGEELTVMQAADRLGVNRLTVQRWCAEEKLSARKEDVPSGWRWRIPVSEIERLEKERA